MQITTKDVSFKVNMSLKPNAWYGSFADKGLDTWEPSSYHMLDMFQNKEDGVFIDIGAWIGPLTLYAAHKYDKVIAIEADPFANISLKANVKSNDFKNVQIIDRAISNTDDENVKFGGNGPLGNSESTLMVNDKNYEDITKKYTDLTHNTHTETVNVKTITLDKIIKTTDLDVSKISFIKIDIEGSEKLVLPHIKDFLISCNAPLHLSLHPGFLEKNDILMLVDEVFEIYPNAYYINTDLEKSKIEKDVIVQEVEHFYNLSDFKSVKVDDPGTRYFELLLTK